MFPSHVTPSQPLVRPLSRNSQRTARNYSDWGYNLSGITHNVNRARTQEGQNEIISNAQLQHLQRNPYVVPDDPTDYSPEEVQAYLDRLIPVQPAPGGSAYPSEAEYFYPQPASTQPLAHYGKYIPAGNGGFNTALYSAPQVGYVPPMENFAGGDNSFEPLYLGYGPSHPTHIPSTKPSQSFAAMWAAQDQAGIEKFLDPNTVRPRPEDALSATSSSHLVPPSSEASGSTGASGAVRNSRTRHGATSTVSAASSGGASVTGATKRKLAWEAEKAKAKAGNPWTDLRGQVHRASSEVPMHKFERKGRYYNAEPDGEGGYNYSPNPKTAVQQEASQKARNARTSVRNQALRKAEKAKAKAGNPWTDLRGQVHRASSEVPGHKFERKGKYYNAEPDGEGGYNYSPNPDAKARKKKGSSNAPGPSRCSSLSTDAESDEE